MDKEEENFFSLYNDLVDFLKKYEASVHENGTMGFLHPLTDRLNGNDWNQLYEALQDSQQDPLKIRLNLMDVRVVAVFPF